MSFPSIQQLRKQNASMSKTIESYLQQIQKQKLINQQKEDQIQSLLKFNERLLSIIETQMNTNKKNNVSLMPISEKSQGDSDIMNPLSSLIQNRKIMVDKSQQGTKSVIQTPNSDIKKLQQMGKHLQTSQFVNSQDGQDSQLISIKAKPANRITINRVENQDNDRKYSEMATKMQFDISNEMKKIRTCAEKNKGFYDEKLNQLKNLSEKIGTYRPEEKFNQIAKKIPMSATIAELVKKAMMSRKP